MPIEQCPVSSPLINRGIAALWTMGQSSRQDPAGVREVEFFANADDTQLLVELSCSAKRAARPCACLPKSCVPPCLKSKAWSHFAAPSPARGAGAPEPLLILRRALSHLPHGHASYRVSSGAFFQTNRHLTDELVKIVTQGHSGELDGSWLSTFMPEWDCFPQP